MPPDLELLPYSGAAASRVESVQAERLVVESAPGAGMRWKGPARVDGQPWPASEEGTVWLPAGRHVVEVAPEKPGPHLLSLNGDLQSARWLSDTSLTFSYVSLARAIARFDRPPTRVFIDGEPRLPERSATLILPNGRHSITVFTE